MDSNYMKLIRIDLKNIFRLKPCSSITTSNHNPPAPNADQPGFLTGRISSSAGDVSIRGKGNILRLGEEAEKINRITKPKN